VRSSDKCAGSIGDMAMKKIIAFLFAGLVMLVPTIAFAALPLGVDTALTGIETDAIALAALVAPVLIGILALTIVFKLVKRFGNKI